jgi:anti-sigma factor RsiW
MHEDLLGYLLGALEPDEMQRVSDWLRDNPEGQRQLAELERSLRPLEEGFEPVEGPSDDLLARTLAAIPEGLPPQERPPQESSTDEPTGETDAAAVRLADVNMAREVDPSNSRWSIWDSIGSLLSAAALLALLLPTIAEGRFEARKQACQDQLRQFGTALMQYVTRDQQNRLPEVAQSGPEAFSGVSYLRLADAGLVLDPGQRWCPSADLPVVARQTQPAREASGASQERVLLDPTAAPPSVKRLHQLDVNELQQVQRLAGGHYAYSLGVISEEGYTPPKFEARTAFAIMADAPLVNYPVSIEAAEPRYSHGGVGINVLYEDGAVRFVRVDALDWMPDHPLRNHVGAREAGVNVDDASLAPSPQPPFMISVQR